MNWKNYWSKRVRPYIGSEVLDGGAGSGATADLLSSVRTRRWLALEPDRRLVAKIVSKIADGRLLNCCGIRVGFVSDLSESERFDSIIYADVLERIEDDSLELERASKSLKPGGNLLVLTPAHQFLYSPFDHAVGHHRRYNKKSLSLAAPRALRLIQMPYLDSFGLLVSAANRSMLRSSLPSLRQIMIWDRAVVPLSRLDRPHLSGPV